jgi:hypothetical protein
LTVEDFMAAQDAVRTEDDARIVRDLEAVYRQVQTAATSGSNPERWGVLNSLRLMLEPSLRAARLLVEDDQVQLVQRR